MLKLLKKLYSKNVRVFTCVCLAILFIFASLDEVFITRYDKDRFLFHTHTFVHSAYFYNESKSLGKYAVAIVATMNKRTGGNILDMDVNIVATNHSMNRLVTKASLTTEHLLEDHCDYAMVLLQANTIFNMSKLEIESHGGLITLDIKKPLEESPKPVVFCVAPQFAAEQWQTFLAQVHISNYYGAHLHVYVISMVESYFKLLREYEKLGYLTIEPWLTIKFAHVDEPVADPYRNVDYRGQSAAHTDCLLMYKEAAKYIGIIDMDDLLIPTTSTSYYEEFEKAYNGNRMFSALNYMKYEFETVTSSSINDTSIKMMIKHSKKLGTNRMGKSYFLSERYNSTGSHWSRNADNYPQYSAEGKKPFYTSLERPKNIGIFHIEKTVSKSTKDLEQLGIGNIPLNPADNETFLITDENLSKIEEDFQRVWKSTKIKDIARDLPEEEFYTPLIRHCFKQSLFLSRDFESLNQQHTCMNIYDCELPKNDSFTCIHSDGTYSSGYRMHPITYHFASEPFFSRNIGCYQ